MLDRIPYQAEGVTVSFRTPVPPVHTPIISQATRDLARRYLASLGHPGQCLGSNLDQITSLVYIHTPGMDPEVARLAAAALAGVDPTQAAENLARAAYALRPV